MREAGAARARHRGRDGDVQPRLQASRWSGAGIELVETAVGDRYVLEAMQAGGYTLGGEQSGHVIMLDHATTGDGTADRAAPARRVAATGQPLAELAGVVHAAAAGAGQRARRRQVRASRTSGGRATPSRRPRRELGATGRVLLRPSGTEPLVRVMVEAPTHDEAQAVADRLADVVSSALGR